MAEQLANLYSTTLASSYTAGAGSISVTSASGAPTSGTFDVAILNASTGAVILLFRVTSVSGTTFTGAAEGTDANAASGSTVIGTVLTSASVTQLFADHPGFIQPLTPPSAGSFSAINFNVGSGVVTTQVNNSSPVTSITLQQADPSHTGNTVAISKAIINGLYTVTVGISLMSTPNAGAIQGLWLNDGGSNCIYFGIYNQFELLIWTINSLTNSGAGASNINSQSQFLVFGPLLWLRIQETSSNRIYSLSADGKLFFPWYTESNTAHFTTVNYGIATFMYNSGGTSQICLNSFQETTP